MKQAATKARPKLPKKQGWKLAVKLVGLAFWAMVVVFVAQVVVGIVMAGIMTLATGSRETAVALLSEPVWTAVYLALAYSLALVALIFLSPRLYNLLTRRKQKRAEKPVPAEKPVLAEKTVSARTPSREELGLKGLLTWTDLGLAPVGFVAYLLLAVGLTTVFSLFPWFNAEEAQDVGFNVLSSNGDRLVAFLALVVIAPIAEEIIFRGWMYGKMRKSLSKKTADWLGMTISIILTSLAFGIMHGQWNVGVNVFAMSVVLCGLREITGTTYSGIVVHMLKNGVAFYLLYVLGM